MHKLTGTLRSYPWGSRTLIPELRGEPSPSSRPEAELWFGAHPVGSALVDGIPLTDIIAADPQAALGPRVQREFGDGLPFMLKLLGAAEPLSLQAHPSAEQARDGFDRENQLGIPLTALNRNYRDPFHKPELVVALTDFYAMVGFRPLERTLELFSALHCPELDRYLTILDPESEESSLRGLFTTWITIPSVARNELIDGIVRAAREQLDRDDWISGVLRTVLELHERYPGDIGVLGALLLNHLVLRPGEAIFLEAGHLHAYVSGLGVEVMANSDNVLRGGLTSKYVDVPELVRILRFNSITDPVVKVRDGEYPVPAPEFRLHRFELAPADAFGYDHDGPAIALCTAGEVQLGNLGLLPGEAAWIPAGDPEWEVSSVEGGELFIACA
ncbi:MAG: mannose-6-phosphate isomerase, class I [Corynebacterium humireducens]|jgi:mannose-6-phosphate isomerase|uniref:mannose-6-phosphate isomerase n=2 Tax=Corynebacterium humireducens TaxID=1223514 RepID=A0A0B5D863_9CORY|nr:mannose-6-phosphate isomerase, class I [Corynebacterium humireducens]AJE32408.1 mannose-6-phosphate isomerase [Corynebacterium humireducens NBRC 106098 = DSM 45392]NLA55945.1 mannose-6-phosphate isomerase, class I [Corynebacterium humireducens]